MLILIHGLGQDSSGWSKVTDNLKDVDFEAPNVFELSKNGSKTFENIYADFEKYCDQFEEKIDLCGLSLGGSLALKYAIENPEKVNKIIIIAGIYKVPKLLFSIQNAFFQIIPARIFEKTKLPKKKITLELLDSMKNLNFEEDLSKIKAPSLILCGEKDFVNKKQSENLAKILKNSEFKAVENSSHEVNI